MNRNRSNMSGVFKRILRRRGMSLFILTLSGILLLSCGRAAAETRSGIASSSDGLEIAWEINSSAAVPADRPALVMVHGWCCDRSYWASQVEGLGGRYTVVTIDLGGHGESGMDRKVWSMESFASDVACVVEELDLGEVILVGHSMGGTIIAGAAPLLGEKVIGLVGVDTYQGIGTRYGAEQVEAFLQPFKNDFVSMTKMFVGSMFTADADPELVARIAADMSSAPPEVGIGAMTSMLGMDPSTLFGGLAMPVVAINSDKFPTDLAAARSLVPQFELKLMKGLGHFLMNEDPKGFNSLLAETAEEITLRD